MRPPMPSMLISRRTKILASVVVILIVLIIALVKLSGVYVNHLWFSSLGHSGVYSTVLWTRVVLFFSFGAVMTLVIAGNLALAYRLRPPFRPMSPEQQNLQHYVVMVEPRRKLILAVVAVITFLSAGASAQGGWATWQLFFNGGSFGVKDPQFGRDISFYAFDYPLYRTLLSFGFTAIIFSLILSIVVHYLTGAIRLQTPGPKVTVSARRHLTVLVFVFMILKAMAYWLDRYGLVFSSRSKFTGASYTDVHYELPAKTILFWIAIVLAAGVLASLWLKSVLLPGIGFVVLLVLSILVGGILPYTVQSLSVSPNASDKERPYISDNIKYTRQAYDIVTNEGTNGGSVSYLPYNADTKPQTAALTDANSTVDNIRLLDPNVLSPTFTAAQKIGLPYAFTNDLNVDRYTLDGQTHDYVVAVRELAPGSNLTGSQNNWINQHTVYTHGYGFVAARADVDVTTGAAYTEGNIPPSGPLGLTQPDVYFGQLGNGFAIVGAQGRRREYDGKGDYITYRGGGGVSLSNPFTKLAFALKYKDSNFVLNDAVSAKGAKIIFVGNPQARLQKLAPFLTVDSTPFPFVDKQTGHIMWMLDGYTTMSDYPYSQRQSLSNLTHTSLLRGQQDTQINYIRNSVKATVDAYTGAVKIYDWDSSDPILRAWMHVFPGLVQPKKDMPADVLAHVRYPQDFFDVQRGLLAQYHITDPQASYNGKGKWAVPSDPFDSSGADQPPYYVLARPADALDDNTPQFQLTSPMVVNGATNLAAYISADISPSGAEKLTVLQVTNTTNIYGPSQVANDLKSSAVISRDISLLGTGQSQVVHGNLLTLPVGNSFLYVEPLYVTSTGGSASFPTLQRVLVRYGNGDSAGSVGYGATLQAALSDIIDDVPAGSSLGTLGQTTTSTGQKSQPGGSSASPSASPSSTPSSSTTTTPIPQTDQQILAQLASVQSQLAQAKSANDFTEYAALLQQQQDLVAQLLKSGGSTPSASRSPSPSASPSK